MKSITNVANSPAGRLVLKTNTALACHGEATTKPLGFDISGVK